MPSNPMSDFLFVHALRMLARFTKQASIVRTCEAFIQKASVMFAHGTRKKISARFAWF
jgi:hypothetical protein